MQNRRIATIARFMLVFFVVIIGTTAPGPAQESEDLSEDAAVIDDLLRHASYLRFSAVRRYLVERPETSVPILIELLDHSRWEMIRRMAAAALKEMNASRDR